MNTMRRIQKIKSSRSLACVVLLFILPTLGACSYFNQEDSKLSFGAVRFSTILPDSFLAQTKTAGTVEMPISLIEAYQSNRNHVDLREGPGVNYRLKGSLILGEVLILSARKGVWRKIVSLDRNVRGWVHHKRLSRVLNDKNIVSIYPARVQQVFAIRDVHHIYSYSKRRQLSVKIPKGRSFPLLRKKGKWNLIWLPETNSLAWALNSTIQ